MSSTTGRRWNLHVDGENYWTACDLDNRRCLEERFHVEVMPVADHEARLAEEKARVDELAEAQDHSLTRIAELLDERDGLIRERDEAHAKLAEAKGVAEIMRGNITLLANTVKKYVDENEALRARNAELERVVEAAKAVALEFTMYAGECAADRAGLLVAAVNALSKSAPAQDAKKEEA